MCLNIPAGVQALSSSRQTEFKLMAHLFYHTNCFNSDTCGPPAAKPQKNVRLEKSFCIDIHDNPIHLPAS